MSARSAVVVGALVAALFIAVLVIGVDDEGTGTDTDALLDRLRGLVGDPAAIPAEDIIAGCRDDDDPTLLTFTSPASCILVVRTDRALGTVRLVAGSRISITAPAPRSDVTVESDADPGDEVTVAVGEGETRITLACPGVATTCEARLVQ